MGCVRREMGCPQRIDVVSHEDKQLESGLSLHQEGRKEGVEASWDWKKELKSLETERRYRKHSRRSRSPGTLRVALFIASKLYGCHNSSHSTRRTAKWKCNGQNNINQATPIYAVSTLIEPVSILLLWCPTPNWLCTRKYRRLPTWTIRPACFYLSWTSSIAISRIWWMRPRSADPWSVRTTFH